MKAIIVDDENKARQLLRAMLSDLCPNVEVVADCDDLPNGVKAIKRHSPDLVFLDIEMPGHSGLELLDFFNDDEVNFNIIFTTAYDHYAIQAFKLSAVDYLLKPLSPKDLVEAVERATDIRSVIIHACSCCATI
jgi:two-component system LytT family response regulator